MLTTEWNWDTAKRVWQDEAREEGIGVGLAQGREEGIGVGLAQGREEGRVEKQIIAKNLLEKGSTPEFVHEITGLSLDEIRRLKN